MILLTKNLFRVSKWNRKKLEESVASLLENAASDKKQVAEEMKEIKSSVAMVKTGLGGQIDRIAVSIEMIINYYMTHFIFWIKYFLGKYKWHPHFWCNMPRIFRTWQSGKWNFQDSTKSRFACIRCRMRIQWKSRFHCVETKTMDWRRFHFSANWRSKMFRTKLLHSQFRIFSFRSANWGKKSHWKYVLVA